MTRGGARPAARPRRRGAHASRPRRPLRQRLRPGLPSASRTIAALAFAALLAALVGLVNGPWLRVQTIAFAGQRLTSTEQLRAATESLRGVPLLSLDSDRLAEQLRSLPAVAGIRIEPALPDRVRVVVSEKPPAFVWRTARARLVGATDGTLLASLGLDGDLPTELRSLPLVDDRRRGGLELRAGEKLPAGMIDSARRLLAIDPARLGSVAKRLSLRLDDEHGFLLVSSQPAWQVAFGLYGLDPTDEQKQDGRIDQQVAAVRTLFAAHPEASVSWVDARNPGKVYFRAKG